MTISDSRNKVIGETIVRVAEKIIADNKKAKAKKDEEEYDYPNL